MFVYQCQILKIIILAEKVVGIRIISSISFLVNYVIYLLRPYIRRKFKNIMSRGFPGGTEVKNLPANAGDKGSSPGLGRSHMPQSN